MHWRWQEQHMLWNSDWIVSNTEVQNADDAITFKTLSDDKVHELNATTISLISAGDTITSTITSNYCTPLCSAVYRNKTILHHSMQFIKYLVSEFCQEFKSVHWLNLWLNDQCKFGGNSEHPNFTRKNCHQTCTDHSVKG